PHVVPPGSTPARGAARPIPAGPVPSPTELIRHLGSQVVHPVACRPENSTFDLVPQVRNRGVQMYRHSGRVAQRRHIAVDEIDLSLPATLEVLEHRGFDIPVEGKD